MKKEFTFEYKGECESIILPKGRYFLEVWGAEGGNCGYENNGGGYSKGTLLVREEERYYICVGGKGESSKSLPLGGFNGGGNGTIGLWEECGGGGGGATDIRQQNLSVEARIIVAGGSGGLYYYQKTGIMEHYKGGGGGGHSGGDGIGEHDGFAGKGGTNSDGGEGGYYDESVTAEGYPGVLFQGGNATTTAGASPGGGGGGYYGGGGGADLAGGGGGSGYVSPILIGAETTTSNHKGNGEAKITLLQPFYLTCASKSINVKLGALLFYLFTSFS